MSRRMAVASVASSRVLSNCAAGETVDFRCITSSALVSLAGQSAIIAHHLIVGAADRGIACGVTVEDIV